MAISPSKEGLVQVKSDLASPGSLVIPSAKARCSDSIQSRTIVYRKLHCILETTSEILVSFPQVVGELFLRVQKMTGMTGMTQLLSPNV